MKKWRKEVIHIQGLVHMSNIQCYQDIDMPVLYTNVTHANRWHNQIIMFY